MSVDLKAVKPAERMACSDPEEDALLRELLDEAQGYLQSFSWCRGIKASFFGCGVGGVLGVFLFQIDAPPGVDEWLWVVVGDLPSCYMVTDDAPDPVAALEVYCELMDEWITAVRAGQVPSEVFPVAAPQTAENASLLDARVAFVRKELIPQFRLPE